MKLRVGLLAGSRAWGELLSGEGVQCAVVEDQEDLKETEWSAIIVSRGLTSAERDQVEAYLRRGGAVLGAAKYLLGVGGTEAYPARVAYLVPDRNDRFGGIGLTDVNLDGMIPREANMMRTQAQVFGVFAGSLLGGTAVILPFDVEEALAGSRAVNKNFASVRERLPSERVSVVARGEIRHLIASALQFLHSMRGIPYVHLWYFPGGRKNLFAFRVDTDQSGRAEIDAQYAAAREHHVGMSWFLDVKSHESWLDHFLYMADQEIGLHCYEHAVAPDYDTNARNMERGKRVMEAAGLVPKGFAAPYGIWNLRLARAIDDLGFEYSSEFSFAYDTFPARPITHEFEGLALQVPVHPISTGSLRRVGYSEPQMSDYFRMVLEQKVARDEPLFFYHHPIHRHWNVIHRLFSDIQERAIESTTFVDFARWWAKRALSRYAVGYENERFTIRREMETAIVPPDDLFLRIVRPSGEEALAPISEQIDAKNLSWNRRAPYQFPVDLSRIREFDPRRLLGDLYTSMTRRLR